MRRKVRLVKSIMRRKDALSAFGRLPRPSGYLSAVLLSLAAVMTTGMHSYVGQSSPLHAPTSAASSNAQRGSTPSLSSASAQPAPASPKHLPVPSQSSASCPSNGPVEESCWTQYAAGQKTILTIVIDGPSRERPDTAILSLGPKTITALSEKLTVIVPYGADYDVGGAFLLGLAQTRQLDFRGPIPKAGPTSIVLTFGSAAIASAGTTPSAAGRTSPSSWPVLLVCLSLVIAMLGAALLWRSRARPATNVRSHATIGFTGDRDDRNVPGGHRRLSTPAPAPAPAARRETGRREAADAEDGRHVRGDGSAAELVLLRPRSGYDDVRPLAPPTRSSARMLHSASPEHHLPAVVYTVLNPQGYVEIDGVLRRARWEGGSEPPGIGRRVRVIATNDGLIVIPDSTNIHSGDAESLV